MSRSTKNALTRSGDYSDDKSDSVSLVFEKWQVFQVHLITYKYIHTNGAKHSLLWN